MEPIRKIAVHEQVVDRLRRAIHLGDYLPGDRLPSERDIADLLGVSRESVRGAIRILEDEGYVESRRGASGGLTVTALSEPVARTAERLRADRDALLHLMEFRRVNECLAARLAARRRTDRDLAALGEAVEALKDATDIRRFRRADAAFHLAVAVAAGNPHVERAILEAREAIFLLHGNLDYELVHETTSDAHAGILAAIAAGDAEAAEAAMDEHMSVALREICRVLGIDLSTVAD